MRKGKIWDSICLLIPAALLLWGLLLCVFPAPRYSTSEKRYLADSPAFSASDLFSGKFREDWQLYVIERLPGRGGLRGLHAITELALGKREVGGVILCRDGSLARRMSPDGAVYEKNLRMIARFAEKAAATGKPVTVAVAPRRIDLFPKTLPAGFDVVADAAVYATLQSVLPDAIFLAGYTPGEWFRTDHHWNQRGAHRAYLQLVDALGDTPLPGSSFMPRTISTGFLGTSAAAAGIPGILPDEIELLLVEDDTDFQVKRDGKPAPFAGFYDLSAADTAEPYHVFLGGNCGLIEITRGENDTRPALLVVRDSFASPLLPFLARHYRIVAVDPRYYTAGLKSLLSQVDGVLFLMGMQTVSEAALPAGILK